MISPQPRDIESQIIDNAITDIPTITNYTVVNGEWIPIYTSVDTKNIILQSRSMNNWLFATASGSSDYFTVKNGGALHARLVTQSGTLIGYVSTSQTSEVIELAQAR